MKFLFTPILLLIFSGMVSSQSLMNIQFSNQTTQQLELNNIDSVTYAIDGIGSAPIVTAIDGGLMSAFAYAAGGSIAYEGSSPVSSRGVCWGNTTNPTVNDSLVVSDGGQDFLCLLNALYPGEMYYVRAYAANATDTAYSEEFSFEIQEFQPCAGAETVSDADGNNYPTVQIGGQCWMAENLRTSSYANGDPISQPMLVDWESGVIAEGAWCWYEDDSQYDDPYGKLYNYYAVQDERNVCPSGWHIPTAEEWITLLQTIDFTVQVNDTIVETYASSINGKDLLLASEYTSLPAGINYTNFNAVPAGFRACPFNLFCTDIGIDEDNLILTQEDQFVFSMSGQNSGAEVINGGENLNEFTSQGGYAMSIRCVMDQ